MSGDRTTVHRLFVRGCVALCLAFLVFVFYTAAAELVTPRIFAWSGIREGVGRIADLLYHLELAEAYGTGRIPSPYEPESQWRVMSDFYGHPAGRVYAMPVGVTPVAFLFWYALLVLCDHQMASVVSLWLAGSLTALLGSVGFLYGALRPNGGARASIYLLGCILLLGSLPMALAVWLGQTSLFGAAGLLLIASALGHRRAWRRSGSDLEKWLIGLGLALLLWKPPYLALGVGMLVLTGRRKAAAVGGGTAVGLIITATLATDPSLLVEYCRQLVGYTGELETGVYRPTGVEAIGGGTATFRTVLFPFVGKEWAYLMNWPVLLGAFGALLWLGGWERVRGRYEGAKRSGTGRRRLSAPGLVIALFAVYFLFAPYVGRPEDLLFLAPWAVAVMFGLPPGESRGPLAAALVGLAVVAFVPVPETGGALLSFAGRVVALGGMILHVERGARANTGRIAFAERSR